MSENKRYQVRIKVSEKLSEELRSGGQTKSVNMIFEISKKYDVSLICTLNAFCEYCKEAEDNEISKYPLYHWTKSVINDPVPIIPLIIPISSAVLLPATVIVPVLVMVVIVPSI